MWSSVAIYSSVLLILQRCSKRLYEVHKVISESTISDEEFGSMEKRVSQYTHET